jgi:hypothetical protein
MNRTARVNSFYYYKLLRFAKLSIEDFKKVVVIGEIPRAPHYINKYLELHVQAVKPSRKQAMEIDNQIFELFRFLDLEPNEETFYYLALMYSHLDMIDPIKGLKEKAKEMKLTTTQMDQEIAIVLSRHNQKEYLMDLIDEMLSSDINTFAQHEAVFEAFLNLPNGIYVLNSLARQMKEWDYQPPDSIMIPVIRYLCKEGKQVLESGNRGWKAIEHIFKMILSPNINLAKLKFRPYLEGLDQLYEALLSIPAAEDFTPLFGELLEKTWANILIKGLRKYNRIMERPNLPAIWEYGVRDTPRNVIIRWYLIQEEPEKAFKLAKQRKIQSRATLLHLLRDGIKNRKAIPRSDIMSLIDQLLTWEPSRLNIRGQEVQDIIEYLVTGKGSQDDQCWKRVCKLLQAIIKSDTARMFPTTAVLLEHWAFFQNPTYHQAICELLVDLYKQNKYL